MTSLSQLDLCCYLLWFSLHGDVVIAAIVVVVVVVGGDVDVAAIDVGCGGDVVVAAIVVVGSAGDVVIVVGA